MGSVGRALSIRGREDGENERHGQDGLQAPASRIAQARTQCICCTAGYTPAVNVNLRTCPFELELREE